MNYPALLLFSITLLCCSCGRADVSANDRILQQETAGNKNDLAMTNPNWIDFIPGATAGFSDSFKKKMTEALREKLYGIFEDQIDNSEFEFALTIGNPEPVHTTDSMIMKPFEVTSQGNYAFARANITTVFAQTYYLTVAWTSPDFSNPLDISKADVGVKNIEFSWCTDFPKQEILENVAPVKVLNKKQSGYAFDVKYFLKVFPDVTIFFDFEGQPSDACLKEVQAEVNKFRDEFKTVYVSAMEKYKGYYIISIDHNTINYDTYSDADYQKDVDHFDFLLKNIDHNPLITHLKEIKFQ